MSAIRSVKLPDLVLGEPSARPTVIVPVLGATAEEIASQVADFAGRDVDLVEWRVDHLAASADAGAVLDAATAVATRLGGRPLLATVRTAAEGGAADLSDREYARLVQALAGSGVVDMVDVEHGRESAVEAIAAARGAGVPVVVSAHDVVTTPPVEEMVDRLRAMQDSGADVVKLAVTPHSQADVLALLEATSTMHTEHARVPVITMAMGPLGMVTRLVGHLFGSAATFASAGRASAPGQPGLADLQSVLDAVARVTAPAQARPAGS
ncbi:type I 3-dehydroquinate dehydratase [Georgenia halophila]|uniref:type I 3-dehydroquinate dehydratase n=1 Tax=Georgenia halophila TaxID=620889 RepID=UPI0031E5A989